MTSVMTGTFATRRAQRNRWEARGLAAGSLRAAVVAVPLLASAVAGVIVGSTMVGDEPVDIVARLAAALAASLAAFGLVEWAARRLLPLAVLLRLSLVFPDHAPSRFAVALRSTSVRRLQEWARTNHDPLDAQALAEKVLTLASALNFHDRRTRGHSERTRALAELVIDELGLSEAEANEVRWGAFLHDIGKLLVPSVILNKPGALTPAEWAQLRQHPAEGGRLVRPLRPFIGAGVDAVACHHEFFDGNGYPNGLRGEEIPLAARIVAVVDSFEVMTAVRSYKRPMSVAAARHELVRVAGTQFDPAVVRSFVNVSLGRMHWSLGVVAWIAELPVIGVVPRAAAQVGAVVGAGSSAVSTATLASVATATLGASLVINPIAAPPPAAASTPSPPAAAAAAPVAPSAPGPTVTTASPNATPAPSKATPGTLPAVTVAVGQGAGQGNGGASEATTGPGAPGSSDSGGGRSVATGTTAGTPGAGSGGSGNSTGSVVAPVLTTVGGNLGVVGTGSGGSGTSGLLTTGTNGSPPSQGGSATVQGQTTSQAQQAQGTPPAQPTGQGTSTLPLTPPSVHIGTVSGLSGTSSEVAGTVAGVSSVVART